MKITTISRSDYSDIKILVNGYNDEAYTDEGETDEASISKLLNMIVMGAGVGLIARKDEQIVGCILAVTTPSLWKKDNYTLRDVMFYVLPEYRNSTAGGRLLKKYCEVAEEMKDNDLIKYYTMSQTVRTDLNYEKYGFKKMETTYVQ